MSEALLPQGVKWNKLGFSVLGGESFKLFTNLDKMFVRLSQKSSAEEHHFPVFMDASELKKLDYFKSFPQLIHFPVSLNQDDENLRAFANGTNMNERGEVQLTETAPICECLTPAACYHFYIYYQGQNLAKSLQLTTRAHCFRQEKFYEPLKRQRNFNMREIVCIGTAEEVKTFLEKHKEMMSAAFEALNIPVSWDIATDPFFDPGLNPKALMQQLDPVKQEMIYKKDTSEELSLGSINYHKDYFGEAFNIKINGQTAFSGCVAFGLERWIHALAQVYGTDTTKWPELGGMFL
jgi:seryl-tRNA synthetase